ncbi:MAG: glycoside hydrolase family 3 N-terminal domain-containing protein [Nocardioides sp.]
MTRRSSGATGAAAALVLALCVVPLTRASAAPPRHASHCTNQHRLHDWGTRRLAEQTVVVPVQETAVGDAEPEVADGAGGVILFGSRAPDDLASRLAALTAQAPDGIAPIVMTDEEGGTVQRMADLVGSVPSARHMGSTMTPRHIHRIAHRLGTRMKAAGVTMDLAPVLDLDGRAGPNDDDAIGTRSFSPRRRVATPAGLAFAQGLEDGGEIPVVKHFPGLGSANGNTDLRLAATEPWRLLRKNDLLPFEAAVDAGVPSVMVSNARIPGLTKLPASLARPVVHRVLRHQLGFHGLVLPDSLTAGAVVAAGYSLARAAVRALVVGDDMVLFNTASAHLPATTRHVVDALVSAVRSGDLSRDRLESAVGHVLSAKHVDLCARR